MSSTEASEPQPLRRAAEGGSSTERTAPTRIIEAERGTESALTAATKGATEANQDLPVGLKSENEARTKVLEDQGKLPKFSIGGGASVPPESGSLYGQSTIEKLKSVDQARALSEPLDRLTQPGKAESKTKDLKDDAERLTKLFGTLQTEKQASRRTLQDIGDTLSTLNSEQIKILRQNLKREDGTSILDDLKTSKKVPNAEKAAYEIYLEGTDNRNPENVNRLIQNALDNKNFTLLQQALRNSTPAEREAVKKSLKPNQIDEAFGQPSVIGDAHTAEVNPIAYKETRESKFAHELVKDGHLSFSSILQEQKSVFGTSSESIKASIDQLTTEQKDSIKRGALLSLIARLGTDKAPFNEGELGDLKQYQDANQALSTVTNPVDAIKWLDYADNGGTKLVKNLSEHRSVVLGTDNNAINNDLQNISREDWQRGKTDPVYQQRLRELTFYLQGNQGLLGELTGGWQDRKDFQKSSDILDQKFAPQVDTFEKSQIASDKLLSQVEYEKTKLLPDDSKTVGALIKADGGERERYRSDQEYQKKLEQEIFTTLQSDISKEIARKLLDQIKEGKQPELSLTDNLKLFADQGAASFEPGNQRRLLTTIQESLQKDSSLKERILNPGPQDKELIEALHQAFPKVQAVGPGQIDKPFPAQADRTGQVDLFDTYVKPLAQNGRLDLKQEASLGTFDRISFTSAIGNASESDRKALLENPQQQHRIIGYWSQSEQEIALRTAKTGELTPEDKLHLAISSKDKAKVEETYRETDQALRPLLLNLYEKRHGNLNESLAENFKGTNLQSLKDGFTPTPNDDRVAFNQQRDRYYQSREGVFSNFVHSITGTGVLADNAHNSFAGRLTEASKRYETLAPAEREKLFKNSQEAVKQFIESKVTTTEAIVDTAIAVATLPGGGGPGLLLRGVGLAAAARPGGKALLLGDDYDGNIQRDAILGGANGALNRLGPAQVNKLFGLGEEASKVTTTSLVEKSLIRESQAGAFTTGLNDLVTESLKNGGKIDSERLRQLTKTFALEGQDKFLAGTIRTELEKSSESVLRSFLKKEIIPNTIATSTGAGANQVIEGGLDGKPTSETLARALTSIALAAPFTAGVHTLARAKSFHQEFSERPNALDSILRKTVTSPELARKDWADFVSKHHFDLKEPKNAIPTNELFEAPRQGKANFNIGDRVLHNAPANQTIEKDVIIYKVKDRNLEFSIEKGYAQKLDEVRELRLSAAQVGSSDAPIARQAREAERQLEKHPNRDAVLPEQVVQLLPELPNSANIRRVELHEQKGRIIKDAEGTGEAAADASRSYTVRLFAGTDQGYLREVNQHENAHFLQYRYDKENTAFFAAAKADKSAGQPFFGRKYATTNDYEDFAVHFGEYFTNSKSSDFGLLAHAAPARSIAAAAFLDKAINDLPTAERSLYHAQFQERVNYVQKNIVPEYRQQIESAIKSGDFKQLKIHSDFIDELGKSEKGKEFARLLAPSDKDFANIRSTIEKQLANGRSQQVKDGIDLLLTLEQKQSRGTQELIKKAISDPSITTSGDIGTVIFWLKDARGPESAEILLKFGQARGNVDASVVKAALRGLDSSELQQVLDSPSNKAILKGTAGAILEAANGSDKKNLFALFQAAREAGGPVSTEALDGLRWVYSNTYGSARNEVGEFFNRHVLEYGKQLRERIAKGEKVSDSTILLHSPDIQDRLAFLQYRFSQTGEKWDLEFTGFLVGGLSNDKIKELAVKAEPYLTKDSNESLKKHLNHWGIILD